MQIAEPGQSAVKACKKVAVGIDLGTTNSVVARVENGEVRVFNDAEGQTLVPSVVYYGAGAPVVGRAAVAKQTEAPTETIASAKRFMGRGAEEARREGEISPNEFDLSNPRTVQYALGERRITPVQVSADILAHLAQLASTAMDADIDGAVITVPAYFDDGQRQATRDAGRVAGLEVLRLLAEPTAAAVAYGLEKQKNGMFAVFDLGGGTFDISILKLRDGVFEVQSTGGDSRLGGDDIDQAIAAAAVTDVPPAYALSLARKLKEQLTDEEHAKVVHAGREFTLSRTELGEIARPLLSQCGRACRRALKDAGISTGDLDGVILVGGSTKSPVVKDYVAELFGMTPLGDIDPDRVVAMGAAIQADQLAGGDTDILLLDVIPLSLGLETMGGIVEKVIPRNVTIPFRAKQEFTTYADNQTGFDIHVLQGERETVEACRSLARFVLRGVPPMIAGMAKVEVIFAVDADGILTVSAKEQTSGVENTIEVKPSYGLTDDEIERMLVESYEHAESDLQERNLRVERVEAERVIAALEQAMAKETPPPEQAETIDKHIASLREAIQGENHLAIREATKRLDEASHEWAETRMNRAIRTAAVGRSVSDMETTLE